VIRKKSLVSALLKAYLYIESHDRTDLILNGKKLKEVGVLKMVIVSPLKFQNWKSRSLLFMIS